MDWNDAAESLRRMRGEIDNLLAQIENKPPETPEQEGVRLYHEGVGFSNVWGDCSERNFPVVERVLDAYLEEARSGKPMALVKQTP